MKTKHTSGPWVLKVLENGTREIFANGLKIMTDERYYPWCPDADADWRLIAAAPELLEACKRLSGVMHALGLEGDPSNVYARAAIAKAEGGAA